MRVNAPFIRLLGPPKSSSMTRSQRAGFFMSGLYEREAEGRSRVYGGGEGGTFARRSHAVMHLSRTYRLE